MRKSELKKFFAAQLLKAYEGWQKKDIAADLEITASRLSKILTASQDVDAEVVISVSEKRGCTTDWLLKGVGEGPVNILDILDDASRSVVEGLAPIEGKEPELLVAELVGDALEARAAEMIRQRRTLRPTEIRKLKELMRIVNVNDDVGASQPVRSKVR